ncbi:LANO_0E10352g1_1 [Lachancea nothofagi CBS 11611]|uniref:LANO_0E10352g1_1 n=1 Tax=Lachancea nothofagi CBS 11611 TaxID=1266666 RepID=A0A1G4JWN1_9SACH|nr:LANO_0E10352g1_1 [Lachancea nothofagi CBS 11611]
MKFSSTISALWAASAFVTANPLLRRDTNASVSTASNYTQTATISDAASTTDSILTVTQGSFGALFKPKVMIVNMFYKEESAWIQNLELMYNISVPMLSPEYPYVHANSNYSIMSITTGEGEINAASTITALSMSPLFDLTDTYFLISGIGGGSPDKTTIGSVTFAKYAVQVGLQYEIDSREIPANWTYGYVNLKTNQPNVYPATIYGTEIFELNENLMKRAMHLASNVTLNNGTSGNVAFRQQYNSSQAAYGGPKILACDTATSDVYWSGAVLEQAFSDYVSTVSNNSATYCSTQQEDNASLEAFVRAAKHGLIDYSRITIMPGISDFDRAPEGYSATDFFFAKSLQGGSSSAFTNLYIAGLPFVKDIIAQWDTLYKVNQFEPKNYIGDYFETLGGVKNFGLED